MKIRHLIIIAIFLLVNVAVILSLNFGGGKEAAAETTESVAIIPTLTGQKVTNTASRFNLSGFGTVSSFNTIDLSCEVQGKLTKGKVVLKPGIRFRKGDLLFKVNDTDARYNLRARKSSYINIIANVLPDLKIDFPESYDQWNNYINAIKLNEPLPTLPSWKSAKEKVFLSTRNILTEYFSIKSLEEQLRKYNVYAPFNGVITTAYLTDYAVVGPGTKIIQVVETDNFEIPVSIPAEQLPLVHKGTGARIYTTTGTYKTTGKVVRISEVINKNTQSIDIYIKPDKNADNPLIEGEYVRVEIDQQGEHSGIRIPENAINDNHVYLYSTNDSTLYRRPVEVADINERGAFVKGLKDGSVVITQEVLHYTDSTQYTILIR